MQRNGDSDIRKKDPISENMKKNDPRFRIENNILKGKEVLDPIGWTSLGKFVLDKLEDSENFVGQIDVVTGKEYTYKNMRERSVRCALWMKSQGLVPRDLVTICSHNHLDIAIPCFAALYLGACFNPLDAEMSEKEILHMLKITKPKLAFVSEESAKPVAEAAKKADLDLKIIVFGDVYGFINFETVIGEAEVEKVRSFECTTIGNPNETAIVMCSSGTSGLPKGVALSHQTILRQILRSDITMTGNNCLVFSSLYWISGTMFMFMYLSSEVTKLVVPAFEAYSACELVKKYKINWLLLGSSMINRLLKSGALNEHNLCNIERVFYGGSPLSQVSEKALRKLLPKAELTTVYGLTEIGGALAIQTINSKSGSCGQIIENAELKVIDTETGRLLGSNQRGELLLKTPCMMNYYCDNPRATAEAIDEEGWLHTGDLGYYDEDGEIFVIDRLKELIKYRALQVSPFEIESVMLSHPGVEEVVVVGLPHPIDDEHPMAFVVRATGGKEVTESELMDLVASQLSDCKKLRGGVTFVDRLPKSPSDKIRRRQLRDLAAETFTRTRNSD